MALLNLFNGGLSKRLAPWLINAHESVVNINVDTSDGSLKPELGPLDLSISLDKYFTYYYAGSEWVSSASSRYYQEYRDKLYYSEDSTYPKVYDGINEYRLGIIAPTTAPTIAVGSAGNLTGTYTYCYTYYDSSTGVESMPSPYSSELVVSAQMVNITALVPSVDPQVDTIRIYRLGGDLTVMTLVVELINSSTSYIDDITDLNVNGWILDSYLYKEAPDNLLYLSQAYSMLFGAIGDKLYYSEIGKPHVWSPFNFIDVDDTITGIGFIQEGILVFTRYKTHIVTGTSPETFSKYLFSGNQGCVNHRTIAYVKNTLVWMSTDGMCSSTGAGVQVVSNLALGRFTPNTITAAVWDEVYYLLLENNKLGIFDARYDVSTFREFEFNAGFLGAYNDKLYVQYNSGLYEAFAGEPLNLTYVTPLLTEGVYSTVKMYERIYLITDGTLKFTIYIDGIEVATYDLTGSLQQKDIQIPKVYQRGYGIQFKFEGTGSVKELEYKVLGRQNGK